MRRPIKQTHRALFLALQADAKEFPGGISAIAKHLDMNGNTLANGINPDHESAPPSMSAVLEIIVLAQAKRTVFALSHLVGQVPMDFELEPRDPADAMRLFLALAGKAGKTVTVTSAAAADGHFCAEDRRTMEPFVLALMKAAGEFLQSIRGGSQ
ncbi:hypothetical protein DR66_2366 [Delftia acidovorans]|uniref:phage regulatory CII family protein n=1 Tax=Delftia TaxID=80865 RepID=UPI000501DF8C|nr:MULTISPECIES: phage regulatory CII family protein [Delftia]KFJ09115.1 hypothetical protein DR66_2366 [Delftia acidovorans]PZP60023.1 MAG: hypothetical protein DI604_31690 [Delftia acidovorans]QQB52560.1 hypothetical protein I6H54_10000 [Delftia acidovorans]WEL99667.1 hypothetical protein PW274_05125 [Delftia tsuruhatensis]WQM81721.1 phage regulatory CII family protein [Delftia tsuruhatensis]